MTEKKDLGHGPVEEQPLTAQQQQELHEQEQYFRQAFCSVSCPPLPESLSADAMWEKICSGAGDHQVTVDPASMQEELRQETAKGKGYPLPAAHREKGACAPPAHPGGSLYPGAGGWTVGGLLAAAGAARSDAGSGVRQLAGLHRRVGRVRGSRSDRSGRGYADGGIG